MSLHLAGNFLEWSQKYCLACISSGICGKIQNRRFFGQKMSKMVILAPNPRLWWFLANNFTFWHCVFAGNWFHKYVIACISSETLFTLYNWPSLCRSRYTGGVAFYECDDILNCYWDLYWHILDLILLESLFKMESIDTKLNSFEKAVLIL